MTNRPLLQIVAGVLLVSGAIWLAWMVWNTSGLPHGAYVAPPSGVFIASITIAAVVARRPITAAVLVALSALAIITLLSIAVLPASWVMISSTEPTVRYHLLVAGLALGAAIAGASVVRRERDTDHRMLWLWISALVTLGCLHLLYFTANEAVLVVGMLSAAVVAGGITQVLARRRMIWTCGGGSLIFALIVLDQARREHVLGDIGALVGAMGGVGIFVVLGAIGARIAWRLFRHGDPHKPATIELPTARTS